MCFSFGIHMHMYSYLHVCMRVCVHMLQAHFDEALLLGTIIKLTLSKLCLHLWHHSYRLLPIEVKFSENNSWKRNSILLQMSTTCFAWLELPCLLSSVIYKNL